MVGRIWPGSSRAGSVARTWRRWGTSSVPSGWWRSSSWSGAEAMRCSTRSEEHTSELQSRLHLVCRLLLEKKKTSKAAELNARVRMFRQSDDAVKRHQSQNHHTD